MVYSVLYFKRKIKVLKVFKSVDFGWKIILYVKFKKYFIDIVSLDVKFVRLV